MPVAPAIVAGVAVAASAAGTVATLNAQRQQANAQGEAALTSALDAQERADMAITRYDQLKIAAKVQRDRELAMVSAQRRAANLQVEQTLLQNRLTQLQTSLQQSSIEAQGQQAQLGAQNQATQTKMGAQTQSFEMEAGATNNLLGRGNEQIGQLNEQAQIGAAAATNLNQARQGLNQAEQIGQEQIANQGQTQAELGAQQYALGQAQDVVGQTRMNNQQTMGMAQFNTDMANANYRIANQQLLLARKYGQTNMSIADQYASLISKMGDSERYMANLGSQSLGAGQRINDAMVQASAQAQVGVNDLQSKRNKKAIQAAYQSTLATGSMQSLTQVLAEKQNIANAMAQANMAQSQAPGGLSYLSALAGGVSSAMQLGLFNGGGGGGSQAGMINTMPPASQNPQGIVNYPPVQWGQPLRGSNTISNYPPIQWGDPLR